ncbi:MAG TPA: glycine cleavage system protein H, partial [Elusimicrobiota bacterium]|nr:glycine cleavage system protein H [Elusimicrobiota bacterium]
MSERRYTKSHEWIRVEGKIGHVGISDHAQHEV